MIESSSYIGSQAIDPVLRAERARLYNPAFLPSLPGLAGCLDSIMSDAETGRSYRHTDGGNRHAYEVQFFGSPEPELMEDGLTRLGIIHTMWPHGSVERETYDIEIDHYQTTDGTAGECAYGSSWRLTVYGGGQSALDVRYGIDDDLDVLVNTSADVLAELRPATEYDILHLLHALGHIARHTADDRQGSSLSSI